MKRFIIWSLGISLLLLLTACGESDKKTITLSPTDPEQTLCNARIVHVDSGVLRMITEGKEILSYNNEDQTQEFPKGVKATFYNVKGAKTVFITADEATNIQKTKLLHLRKNVIIRDFRNNEVTYAQDLYWNQKTKRTYSNKPVLQIKANGDRMRGTGFTADEDFNDFRLVNGRFEFTY